MSLAKYLSVALVALVCLSGDQALAQSSNPAPIMGRGQNCLVGVSVPDRCIDGLFKHKPAGVSFRALVPGEFFSCGISGDAKVYCWGYLDSEAGAQYAHMGSKQIPLVGAVVQIGVTNYTGCALLAGGGAWCWGDSDKGLLGADKIVPDTAFAATPVSVKEPLSEIRMTYDAWVVYALSRSGKVLCWGAECYTNSSDAGYHSSPVLMTSPANVIDIETSAGTVYMLTRDGTLWVQGFSKYLDLGKGASSDTFALPVRISLPEAISEVRAGEGGACVLSLSGTIRCWGQIPLLGEGPPNVTTVENGKRYGWRGTPIIVNLPEKAVHLYVGRMGACATSQMHLYCWGETPGISKISHTRPVKIE